MPSIGFRFQATTASLQPQVNKVVAARRKIKKTAKGVPRATRGLRTAARNFINAARSASRLRG